MINGIGVGVISPGTGGTGESNNKPKVIFFGGVITGKDGKADIAKKINELPSIPGNNYKKVAGDEIAYFVGVVMPYDRTATGYRAVYVADGKGKGEYGVGGDLAITNEDLQRIEWDLINSDNPIDFANDPNAEIVHLGEGANIFNIANNLDPVLEITGTTNLYLQITNNELQTTYLFLGNPGEYGLNAGQFTASNLLLIETEEQQEDYITGTYAELKALKDAGALIPGEQYLLTDYQTRFFIDGSNSSGRVKYQEQTAYVSGWAVLDDNYEYELFQGDTVEITYLPEGYAGALQVGDITTVNSANSSYYFRFANGMQSVIGLKFKHYLTRYENIAQDAIINDANGKPVMKPQGIINTEVHDGTAYMDQTAAQNKAVPTEQLILTAASFTDFEPIGYSNTFSEDVVEYDFTNDKILNDNLEEIGTRPGLVERRFNLNLSMDLPLDWRVCRFRRYLLNEDSRTKFLNRDLALDTKAGYLNQFLFSSSNRNATQTAQFYLKKYPEGTAFKVNELGMKTTFSYEVESTISAKDFNIVPLDDNYNPIDVKALKVVGTFSDTVFLGLAGEYSYNLTIDNVSGYFIESTFVSHIELDANSSMRFYNVIALDSMDLNGSGLLMENVQTLGYCVWDKIAETTIYNSIFGVTPGDITGVPEPSNSWIQLLQLSFCTIRDSVYGTRNTPTVLSNVKLSYGSLYTGSTWIQNDYHATTYGRAFYIIDCHFFNFGLRHLHLSKRIRIKDVYTPTVNANRTDNKFLYDFPFAYLGSYEIKFNEASLDLIREYKNANNETVLSIVASAEPEPEA